MATLDVIRRLTLRAKAEGFNETEKDVKSLGDAYESSARRQLSVEKSLQNLERRFITGAKAQQDFEKVQRQVNAVVAQNPALQDRANAVLAEAHKHMTNAGQSGGVLAKQFSLLKAEAEGLAGSLGKVAPFLLAMGPVGLAAGAALAVLTLGFKEAADAALELADKAGKLRDFSDTTGFTVEQLQALQVAGAQVGLSAETVSQGLERFSVAFEEIKTASGAAYVTLKQIDPVLAGQVARADSLTKAYDLYAQALAKADLTQRNLLARQVGGRGGIPTTRLATSINEAGGVEALTAKMNELDKITAEQAKHWDDLGDSIKENTEKAKTNIVSTFASPVLISLNQVSEGLLTISRTVKGTDWTSGWGAMFGGLLTGITSVIPGLNVIVSGINLLKSAAGLSKGATIYSSPIGPADQIGPQMPAGRREELEAVAKQQQVLRDETIRTANEYSKFISVLGSAATPAQTLKNQMLQLDKAVAENGDAATKAAAAQAKGVLQSRYSMDIEGQRIALLGNLATVQDAVTLKRNELTKAEMAGVSVGKEQAAQLLKVAELQAVATKSGATVSALGDAATATEKYGAQVDALNVKLADGTLNQTQYNRALSQIEPTTIIVKDAITELGNAMAQAFIQGQDAAQALDSALKSVAATATSSALKSGVSGLTQALKGGGLGGFDLPTIGANLAVSGAAILLDQILGTSKKAEQEAAAKAATDAMNQANDALKSVTESFNSLTAAADGATTATIKNAKAQFDQLKNAAESAKAAALIVVNTPGNTPAVMAQANANIAAANTAVLDATQKLADFNLRTINEALDSFVSTDLSPIAQGIKDLSDKAKDLDEALILTGRSAEEAAQLVDERLTQSLVMLANKINTDLTRKIDEASGRGWVNQLKDLRAEIADLALGGGDAAKIAEYVRLTVQNIVDSGKLAGSTFENLLAAFPDLTSGVREFSEQAVAAADDIDNAAKVAAAAEQERVDAIKKANEDIVAYLNGLLTGSLSPLSAKAQLDSAKQLYEAQLALAQSGDLTALQDITKSADTLLNASKAFYGSSAGYQRDFTAIQGQLGSLAGGNAGLLSPANDNVAAISAAGFTNMASLLQQLVDLITSGNLSTEAISAAIATQTELLNQQTRFSDRGAA